MQHVSTSVQRVFMGYLLLPVCLQRLLDVLLTMDDMHLDAKLPMEPFGQMLGAIHAPVLPTCTAEADHQMCKASLQIEFHMLLGQWIDMPEKLENLTIVLKKPNHGLIKPRELLIWLIASGIVCASAIEYISSTIS